jgi:hypothetical protein
MPLQVSIKLIHSFLNQFHHPGALPRARLFAWLRRATAWALIGLFLAASAPAVAHAASPAISVEDFWGKVGQTQAWLATDPPAASPDWQAQASQWAQVTQVALPGGQVVGVDTSTIVHLLRARPPDAAKLSRYLAALQQSRALATAPGGAEEARLLNQILARPDFKEETGELNPLQKILQLLSDAVSRLVNFLFGSIDTGLAVPPQITIPLFLLLILAILAFVFRDTLRSLFSETDLAEESGGVGEILSARLATQKAQELSSGGDYRHALRYLYLSALLILDERGLLRYNRTQTNREYLRQVRSRPDLSGHLQVVVDTFDRVWYGLQPIDEASYAEYASHVSALEETRQ